MSNSPKTVRWFDSGVPVDTIDDVWCRIISTEPNNADGENRGTEICRFEKNGEPSDADARLMVAAPVMFEALKAGRKWMGERPVNPTDPCSISAALVIDAYDLAIAMAEGSTEPALAYDHETIVRDSIEGGYNGGAA